MSVFKDSVLASVKHWLRTLSKDARFSQSELRKALAAQADGFFIPTSLSECRVILETLLTWLSNADRIPEERSWTRIRSKAQGLLLAVNSGISRDADAG